MKGYRFVLSVGLLLAFLIACTCTPKQLASVDLPFTPQHRDWWCWAATTEMISEFYGHRVDQCDSAENVGGGSCCTGCTGNCGCWGIGWGASIGDIQDNWTHWDFTYNYSSDSLTWDTLKSTIDCNNSPVQVVWWWTGGGGHVVVAYGYVEAAGQEFVAYYNPLPEDCEKVGGVCSSKAGGEDVVNTYAAFVQTAGHEWGDTFRNFNYTGE